MTILVARHGQTEWNALGKILGTTNIPLTTVGREQARALGVKAALEKPDLIISSPMLRAMETSQLVAEACAGVEIVPDPRLAEINYGIYEGEHRSNEGFWANKSQFAFRFPQGESMLEVAYRVYDLLHEIRETHADKKVLLVCHGGICRMIRTFFVDMNNDEFAHYSPENATMVAYEL